MRTPTRTRPRAELVTLDRLLAPLGAERFLGDYYEAQRSVHIRGDHTKVDWFGFDWAQLDRIITESGIELKIGAVRDGVHVESVLRGCTSIAPLLQSGLTVCARGEDLGKHSPFQQLAARLVTELETIAVDFSCYLSPHDGGFGMHFDHHPVFIVQLEGEKRWRYGARPAVPWATTGLPNRDATTLAMYLGVCPWADGARVEPRDLEEATLVPGDVLFLPAGTWHQARAVGYSLAVTMRWWPHRIYEVLEQVLRDAMPAAAELRRYMPVAPGQPALASPAVEQVLTRCLEQLQRQVAALTPEHLLAKWQANVPASIAASASRFDEESPAASQVERGAPIRTTTTLRRASLAPIEVAANGQTVTVRFARPNGMKREADFPRALLPFITRLRTAGQLQAKELMRWSDSASLDWRSARAILELFVAQGVLAVVNP
jgi:cupin superfamily protein